MNIVCCKVENLKEITLEMQETVEDNYAIENGELIQFPFHCEIPDWDSDKRVQWVQDLNELSKNGGDIFIAEIDKKTVGIASLNSQLFSNNRLQLFSLHIDHRYRKMGVGTMLMKSIISSAKLRGSTALYISAAPKKNTVDFYMKRGAILTKNIDPILFEQEPEDIHLELAL